jgi:hypothetical protein
MEQEPANELAWPEKTSCRFSAADTSSMGQFQEVPKYVVG